VLYEQQIEEERRSGEEREKLIKYATENKSMNQSMRR
jgi:hypothetical protein